ncbi:cell division protein ZipA [Motilimonas eburnea]|nr:cell division protein ZipA [Motilimonas eburnea]
MSGEVTHTPEPAAVVSDSPSQGVEPHGAQMQTADSDDEQYITRSPAFKEPYFDEYGRQHYREPQPIKVKVKHAANVQQPTPAGTAEPLREPAADQGVQPAIAQAPEQPEPVVDAHSAQAYDESKAQAPTEQKAVAPANTASAADVEQPQTTDQAQRNSHQQADNAQQQTSPAADPQEVFVLNVMSSEGQLFAGAELLPTLLNLGFKFGEMDIFHRHLSPTGNGPVLFSMANMVKPGTFDVDHMEQFETHGVSLFMALPCAGDPSNNFALMLHAAEMLASELNGAVFDATRQPLTRQKVNEYKQRINDFERKNALVH